MMIQHDLTGQWQMREMLMGTWMPVSIPGSVISALLENGKIDDPYYRTNEYEVREMMRKDYVFEKTFDVDEKILAMNDIELVCDGLDTIAEIYLNGQCIGKADNMHRTWRFDCRGILEEKNILQIIFRSPIEYVENYKETEGNEITNIAAGAMKGNQYIRKAHSMFGWDWGAQLPDMGIWRNIRIEAFDRMRLTEPLIEQQHSPEGVTLKVKAQLAMSVALTQDWGVDVYDGNSEDLSKMPAMTDRNMTISVFDPDGTKIGMTVSPACSEAAVFEIREPKLWWTNGLGAHPLYKVRIELADKNAVLQEVKEYRIGLRTLTVSQDKDQWGSEFAFKINGVKIFTKGADYIPEDCIYSRITKDRLAMLVDTSVRSNFNCLRVWGGGYYPSDDFYDLCDENGLIVWQDLMYACNVYDFNDDFEKNIIAETKDNVRRLRHHACLGMWCGNNEIESAWHHWPSFQGHSEKLRADYIKQFEYCLPKTVKKYDSQTFYWPSSPSSGGCFDDPDDENRGDTHYWDVWHGQKPFSDYHNHYFRFCSEFGFQSFPSIKTVRTYTEADDRNIFSEVMESHQKNDAANGKMLYYLSENFQYPKDFESKEEVVNILDNYNSTMEAEGKKDQIITYTDMVGTLMSSVTQIIDIISYVLIAFVAISLIVSSIMIGVITYISVLERKKEIGILRAIGASKRNISEVFNAETFIIGLCAGLIGIGLTLIILIPGNAAIHHVAGTNDVNAVLPVQYAAILVILSVILTLIGGLIPSRKAAKSDPVTALRTE